MKKTWFLHERVFTGRGAPDEVRATRLPLKHAGFEFDVDATGVWFFRGSDVPCRLEKPTPVVSVNAGRIKLDAGEFLDPSPESTLTISMTLEGTPIEYPEGEEQDDDS